MKPLLLLALVGCALGCETTADQGKSCRAGCEAAGMSVSRFRPEIGVLIGLCECGRSPDSGTPSGGGGR